MSEVEFETFSRKKVHIKLSTRSKYAVSSIISDLNTIEHLLTRETREGWLLSANERDTSLVGSLGLSSRYKGFYFALAAVVGLVQNILYYRIYSGTLLEFLCPYLPARQAVVLGRLSLDKCLCSWQSQMACLAVTIFFSNLQLFSRYFRMKLYYDPVAATGQGNVVIL
jgi:hypothetical protein